MCAKSLQSCPTHHPDPCLHLHVKFSLSVYLPPNFLLCENTCRTGFGFPLMTSFSLNYLCKDPFFKYGHILRVWWLGLQRIHGVGVCLLRCLSCPTLCDPMDYSLPGSSIRATLQARMLEWVTVSFSRGSSRPRDGT